MILAVALTCLAWGAPPLRADSVEIPARLRSADDAERLSVLDELAAAPRPELVQQRRVLGPHLRRILRKDRSPRARGLAALVLALADGEAALDDLSQSLAEERDPVAEQLLRPAFGALPTGVARKALSVAAFDREDPRRGALAAESLGWLADGAGADDLLAILDTPHHWAVLAGACLGLARVREKRVVAPLLLRLRHPDPAVRAAALDALTTLTGQDFACDAAAWESWWEQAPEDWQLPATEPVGAAPPAAPVPAPPGPAPDAAAPDSSRDGATHGASGGRGRPTFARFFGLDLTGRRVAFVIDFSQSMWGERRNTAERELIDAVKGLPSSHSFAVVLFNGKVWWYRDDPAPARPQEKLDLTLYLPGQETKNFTNIYDALEQAIGLMGEGGAARKDPPGLDEIVLLSDGTPNRGKLKRPEQIVDAVEIWLAKRVPLHTVSLLDEPSPLLEDLARVTGGRHVRHPVAK